MSAKVDPKDGAAAKQVSIHHQQNDFPMSSTVLVRFCTCKMPLKVKSLSLNLIFIQPLYQEEAEGEGEGGGRFGLWEFLTHSPITLGYHEVSN